MKCKSLRHLAMCCALGVELIRLARTMGIYRLLVDGAVVLAP